jgi:hypothetical protein
VEASHCAAYIRGSFTLIARQLPTNKISDSSITIYSRICLSIVFFDGRQNIVNTLHYGRRRASPLYTGEIECIDAMVSAFGTEHVRIFCQLNAFKYIWRLHSTAVVTS